MEEHGGLILSSCLLLNRSTTGVRVAARSVAVQQRLLNFAAHAVSVFVWE
jgi:hypothetical protein